VSQLLHGDAEEVLFPFFSSKVRRVHVAGFSVFEGEGTKVQADSYKTCTKVRIYLLMTLFAYFDQTAAVIISMNKTLNTLQLVHEKAPQPHFFAFLPLPHEHGSFGCETIERGWS
jgi:hypothetical protein